MGYLKMEYLIKMKVLFGFLFLTYSSLSFAGASKPPNSWNPDYVGSILILSDRSAIIRTNLKTFAKAKISSLNNTLKKSHINLKFKLAGSKKLNRRFSTLSQFASDKEVIYLKKKYNADIVYLFSDLDFSFSICGKGYVTTDNDWGFSAGRAASWICGSTHTFIHEIGHNLGLSHTYSGSSSYASGHGTWAWVTRMGYPGVHGGWITKDRFSNPNIKCDSFYKCGDKKEADAARAITENLSRFE